MRLLRFLGVGCLTAVLDMSVFFLLNRTTGQRFVSFALATLVSVTFNYVVVRVFIFEAKAEHLATLPKYLGVHAAGLGIRWFIFDGIIRALQLPPTHWGIYLIAKPAADGMVYSVKYLIQRDFVFKTTRTAAPESDRSGSLDAPESIPPGTTRQSESLL